MNNVASGSQYFLCYTMLLLYTQNMAQRSAVGAESVTSWSVSSTPCYYVFNNSTHLLYTKRVTLEVCCVQTLDLKERKGARKKYLLLRR